jgi:glycopeptide antibiotics resistance protein
MERAVAFMILGGVLCLAFPRHRDMLISILLAIGFTMFLEASQNLVPGRHGETHDFVVKSLAIIVGAVAMWLLKRAHRDPSRH